MSKEVQERVEIIRLLDEIVVELRLLRTEIANMRASRTTDSLNQEMDLRK